MELKKRYSRRSVIRSMVETTALGTALSAQRANADSIKATAFALIGDRYHNSDYIRIGLTRTIVKELGITVDFTDETSLLNAEMLDGYRLLIVLRDGMTWPDGYGGDESSNAAWVATGRPSFAWANPLPICPTCRVPPTWSRSPACSCWATGCASTGTTGGTGHACASGGVPPTG